MNAARKSNIETLNELIESYIQSIGKLDTGDEKNWALIITQALDAGLSREQLCKEFSCSRQTMLRWRTGQTAPGLSAREAMRNRILRMLNSIRPGRKS